MVNTKEYFKLSLIYTFVAAVPNVLQLIVQPLISPMGTANIGRNGVAEGIITLLFTFCIFSMESSISRFYYDVRDNKESFNKLVSSIFTGILIRGGLILVAILALSPFIGQLFKQVALQDFGTYGVALVISAINRAIVTTAVSLFRNEKSIKSFVIVNISSGIFRAAFQLIGVFFFSMSFLGYVWGTAIGSSIVAIAVLIYTYRRCGFHYDKSLNGELYRFAWPLLQYSLIVWGLQYIDRFFLEKGDSGKLGIYTNAMQFAVGLQLIVQGLGNVTQPEIFRYMSERIHKRQEEIKKLSNMFMIQSMVFIVGAIIPAIIFITVFFKPAFLPSASIISIVFVRYILRSQYQLFALPIMFMKRTKIFTTVNILALVVSVLLNIIFIPRLGYYGAIIAFIGANFTQVLVDYYYQQKIIPISWNMKKVMIFPLSILLVGILCEFARVFLSLPVMAGAIIINVITFAGISFLYKNEIKQIVNKRFKFISNV